MKIEIDKEDFVTDCANMLENINIHGHINSKYKNQRKPIVSQIGKEVAKKLGEGLWSYLTAFEHKGGNK